MRWHIGQPLCRIHFPTQRETGSAFVSITLKCRIVATAGAIALFTTFILNLTAVQRVHGQTLLGTWTLKSPLPAVRAEVAAVALGGKLHALGGSLNGVAGPYHDEYDPAIDKWHPDAPLPEPRDHLAVAETNGKIYAFGGFATPVHKNASNAAFEYDPATNAWRVLPPMKVARGSAGAAVVDGKIHVIGGRSLDGVVVATHEVFDPRSGTGPMQRRYRQPVIIWSLLPWMEKFTLSGDA